MTRALIASFFISALLVGCGSRNNSDVDLADEPTPLEAPETWICAGVADPEEWICAETELELIELVGDRPRIATTSKSRPAPGITEDSEENLETEAPIVSVTPVSESTTALDSPISLASKPVEDPIEVARTPIELPVSESSTSIDAPTSDVAVETSSVSVEQSDKTESVQYDEPDTQDLDTTDIETNTSSPAFVSLTGVAPATSSTVSDFDQSESAGNSEPQSTLAVADSPVTSNTYNDNTTEETELEESVPLPDTQPAVEYEPMSTGITAKQVLFGNPGDWIIQVASFASQKNLQKFLDSNPQHEFRQYRVLVQGTEYVTLVMDSLYESSTAAKAASEELELAETDSPPWIRTIRSLQRVLVN